MFKYNKNIELTTGALQKMIESFLANDLPKLEKFKNYYDGKQAILNKSYNDSSKPCSRTITNFCQDIADSYCGYLASPSFITYTSNEDISDIMTILKNNDYQTEDSDFLSDALVYGRAAELMFLDEFGKTRFKLIEPTQCFGIYDDSLTADLLYFVRFYKQNEWVDDDIFIVDLYDNKERKTFHSHGLAGALELVEIVPHYFSQVPANLFSLKDEKSIFECIMGLQDASNELLSDEIDDYSAFCDAYLALIGVDAEPEDIQAMKENRVLVLPEGAMASWLTKPVNDTQIENMLKRIQASIYRIAKCPDFSSETFLGGVSSGVAIKYRLTGMETKAGKIEARMRQALMHRIEIICGIASLKLGEEITTEIQINFTRNVPEDETVLINRVNALKGTVSDATLLAQLPFVSDVDAELEALEEQKQRNMALYPFGHDEASEDEDEN